MSETSNMKYRWLLVLAIICGMAAMIWISLPQAPGAKRQSAELANYSLPDLQGAMHSLPKGEVVLLNFWATWCPPCRKEIPSMIELHETYAPKGLKIVAISVDQQRDALASFVREFKMPFLVLHDAGGPVSKGYGVIRFPETFLIGRDGKIRHHLIGAVDWMSEPVTRTIESLLAEPAEPANGETDGEQAPQG